MKRILMTAALLLLAACEPTPPPQPQTERHPNPVFETQIQAMEKTRAVEAQMEAAAEAQRKELDATTPP